MVLPTVGGMALYPEDQLKDMLHFFRDFTSTAPNSVMTMAGSMIGPPGTPVEGQAAGYIAVCYSGNTAELDHGCLTIAGRYDAEHVA